MLLFFIFVVFLFFFKRKTVLDRPLLASVLSDLFTLNKNNIQDSGSGSDFACIDSGTYSDHSLRYYDAKLKAKLPHIHKRRKWGGKGAITPQ